MHEWKNDIEFSLEKISERVVSLDFSAYLNLLEQKLNELDEEFNEIQKKAKEINDLNEIVNKNNDICEKSEILCDEMINQINEFKSDSIKWQQEMTKSNSEVTDKVMSHEFYIDQLQKFEKSITKKYDILTSDLKKIEINSKEDNVINDKLIKVDEVFFIFLFKCQNCGKINEFQEVIKLLQDKFDSLNLTIKDDIAKSNNNIKALWDSFTLFTASINSKQNFIFYIFI